MGIKAFCTSLWACIRGTCQECRRVEHHLDLIAAYMEPPEWMTCPRCGRPDAQRLRPGEVGCLRCGRFMERA